jgi:hypothetical protein
MFLKIVKKRIVKKKENHIAFHFFKMVMVGAVMVLHVKKRKKFIIKSRFHLYLVINLLKHFPKIQMAKVL